MRSQSSYQAILLFLVLILLPVTGQAFGWPGIDGKIFKPDRFSRPAEALFDSVHAFDALHYRLDLNFVTPGAYLSGAMTLRFKVVYDSLSQIRLHMVKLAADSVFVGGSPASYSRDDTSIVVDLGGQHQPPETLSLRICYHDTVTGRGFYYYPWNSYTMAEPQDARWWFPCYDEPWDKATSEIYATVPDNYKVGSNGILAGVEQDSISQTLTYHWVNNYPVATYLINLIMGDYAAWNDYYVRPNGDSVPIFNMVPHGDSAAAAFDFATVPRMMSIYSSLYGPYPFDKYGQGTVVPAFFGGMENQTMTTFNGTWITGDRTYEFGYAHELAHMWWGDYVTLGDWRNIWLNEGFATYSSAVYNEEQYGHDAFIANMLDYQSTYFDYDRTAGRHPIYSPSDLFGLHVYNKGAWVLHMLRGIIGDSLFFTGLRQYGSMFAYGNASTEEFRNQMETVSGQDLDWFINEWVFNQGYPEYNYAWSYEASGDVFLVHLAIAQVQTNAPIFQMPMTVRIVAGGNNDFPILSSQAIQGFDFIVANPPETLILDPDYWVLKLASQVSGIDIPGGDILPTRVEIELVYPNPFNGSTRITFSVEGRAQQLRLDVFDIQGRLVRALQSGKFQPRDYVVNWDGRDDNGREAASGTYLVRLAGQNRVSSKKITLIK